MRWMRLLLVTGSACSFERAVETQPDRPAADAGVMDEVAWWDMAYARRRQLSLKTTAAVPRGASLTFVANTTALRPDLVLANGDDWRVVYQPPGAPAVELARWIDDVEGGGWDRTTTRTWFRVPDDIAGNATADSIYVYFANPDAEGPPDSLDDVFVYGQDFEDETEWSNNGLAETVAREGPARGGSRALRIDPKGLPASGVHLDISLPDRPLVFSHYGRRDGTAGSFGNLRAFSVEYAERVQPPVWFEMGALVLFAELDSSGRLQLTTPAAVVDWGPYLPNTWYRFEFYYQPSTRQLSARKNDETATQPVVAGTAGPIRSLALEGEGQNGRFRIDNYMIRFWLEDEPEVVLGVDQLRP